MSFFIRLCFWIASAAAFRTKWTTNNCIDGTPEIWDSHQSSDVRLRGHSGSANIQSDRVAYSPRQCAIGAWEHHTCRQFIGDRAILDSATRSGWYFETNAWSECFFSLSPLESIDLMGCSAKPSTHIGICSCKLHTVGLRIAKMVEMYVYEHH